MPWSPRPTIPAWSTDLLYGDHFIFGTSGLAAGPGYPIVQVPAAFPKLCASPTQPTECTQFGVPLGISFFGTAFSEPKLIKLASGFEAATQVRAHNLPTFAETAPSTHVQGTTLAKPTRRGAAALKPPVGHESATPSLVSCGTSHRARQAVRFGAHPPTRRCAPQLTVDLILLRYFIPRIAHRQ